MIIRYEVVDTSRISTEARWAGHEDPIFDTLEEAIQFSLEDLTSWTDGSGIYKIERVIEEPDLTSTVGFMLDDNTRAYGDKVYLGVDGTIRRFKKTYRAHK